MLVLQTRSGCLVYWTSFCRFEHIHNEFNGLVSNCGCWIVWTMQHTRGRLSGRHLLGVGGKQCIHGIENG